MGRTLLPVRASFKSRRKTISDLVESADPIGEADKKTDSQKQEMVETMWKILQANPNTENRIILRRLLRHLTLSTGYLPKGYALSNVISVPDPSHYPLPGGASIVYYATLGRKVSIALKQFFIPPENIKQMIYSDAVAWATLRHPNVLHVIGAYHLNLIGPPRTEHLLALPWLRNRNVSIHIRYIEEELHEQPPLSEWVSQIASALEYLHREGIVHGGMRTSAVMIDDDNIVKLTDYGTEKYIVREDAVSESAAASEPHEWYPPERYRVAGHKAVATSASDIYGFGCIWLHLHSRRIPFYDISEDEDVEPYRIRGVVVSWPIDGLKPPHTLEELHSLEAWHFVRRCLAENPSRRPKAGELQQVAKFDTLWIRQVYSEPEPVDPNRKPNLSPIPFKPPSLYRYFMYRMYLHLRAARKAARSLLARFVPNSQSVAAGRLVSSPAVD